jgi:hypothetical protein
MAKSKTFTCKSCRKKQSRVGVLSECRQTLNIATDEWTNLEVGDTTHAFCLNCCRELTPGQMKKIGLEVING